MKQKYGIVSLVITATAWVVGILCLIVVGMKSDSSEISSGIVNLFVSVSYTHLSCRAGSQRCPPGILPRRCPGTKFTERKYDEMCIRDRSSSGF